MEEDNLDGSQEYQELLKESALYFAKKISKIEAVSHMSNFQLKNIIGNPFLIIMRINSVVNNEDSPLPILKMAALDAKILSLFQEEEAEFLERRYWSKREAGEQIPKELIDAYLECFGTEEYKNTSNAGLQISEDGDKEKEKLL